MGNHASQYPEGVLESTGDSMSLADEEKFESSSASSVAEEQKINQFSVGERHVSKASLNVKVLPSSEYHASTKPLSTPNANDYCSTSEIDSNSNKFTLISNPNDISLEKCAENDSISFETTEKISLFGSSFDSSSSSIVNVSRRSNSCPEEIEEFGLSSEASLLQCVDKMQVVLSIISSSHENSHSISSNSLKSLKDLHQTIGVFLSYSQELNASKNVLSKQEKDDGCIPSFTHTYNISTQSGGEDKSDSSSTESSNHNFSPAGENMSSIAASDDAQCSGTSLSKTSFVEEIDDKCSSTPFTHESIKLIKSTNKKCGDQCCFVENLDAVEIDDSKLVDNVPESTRSCKQVVSPVEGEPSSMPTEAEATCMSIAERLSIEPCLMRSLAALQTSAGVGSLLTDVDTNSGTFNLAKSSTRQMPSHTTMKSTPTPKERPQRNSFSLRRSKSPSRMKVVQNDESTKAQIKCVLQNAKYPGVLNDVLNYDKSAAAIGKAVIKNALAFQKYAELFKIALNQDFVAAAIGKALCKNALSLEDMLQGTNLEKNQVQKDKVVNICDKLSVKRQSNMFQPDQLQDEKNKENESPTIEHLFKQTPCKRKLALEEETRRIKCLALSPKQTLDKVNYDVVKSSKRTKNRSFIESESSFNMLAKSKKKHTLKEIVTNDQVIENNDSNTKYVSRKDKEPEKNPSTLLSHSKVLDQWTVVKTDNKEILQFDESDEETAFYMQSNSGGNFSQVEGQDSQSEDCIQINSNLITGICNNNSKNMDLWVGVYYFVNKYIFCSTCNVNIFNYLRVLDHVSSEAHKANIVQQRKRDALFVNVGSMLQSVWDRIELNLGKTLFYKLIQFADDKFICSLCNIQAHGHLNVIAHVHAMSHQLNVLQKIHSSTTDHSSLFDSCSEISQSKISWPDSMSSSSSSTPISEKDGSIVEWLLPSVPSPSYVSEADLSGIYYFAKNYVFCSVCNINMFNSSIVLGHAHAKSHQANKALQKQMESSKKQANGLSEYNKLGEIWGQIERTLGGMLFHTVLCIDNNADFFCDLCNIQIINPNHMGVLDHVCSSEHNKKLLSYIQCPCSSN